MTTTRSTLLISASVLQEMLKQHPDIELELVKNVSAQVAEVFKRKVNIDTLAQQAMIEINDRLNYKYHLPDVVKKVIKVAAEDAISEQIKSVIDTALRKYVEMEVTKFDKAIHDRLEAKVNAMVSEAFSRLVNAAARLGK